jgi:hypothetical protein
MARSHAFDRLSADFTQPCDPGGRQVAIMRTTALFALAVASFLFAGCGSKSPPPSEMSITKGCTKTACDERMQRDGDACSRCMNACLSADFDCDPSESCSISCGESSTCTDNDRSTCVQQGFHVEPSQDKSDELATACQGAFAHVVDECHLTFGSNYTSSVCDTWARVERPERAADYDCITKVPCDGDFSQCGPAGTTFGDDLCTALAAKCPGVCDSDRLKLLDLDGAWFRDDVAAAVNGCANQDACEDVRSCFEAWIAAVKP